jgi:CheY-like chemotaxis protein
VRDCGSWPDRTDLVSRLRMRARVLRPVRARCGRSARGVIGPRDHPKPLVLIVDDDPWIRDISSELLEDEGFAIASAADGETGLRLATQLQPAAILLDLGLPHMSGGEFLRRFRDRGSRATTPVIIVSGQPSGLSHEASALADGFLGKPVDLSRLMQQLRVVMATQRGDAIASTPRDSEIALASRGDCGQPGDTRHVPSPLSDRRVMCIGTRAE